MAAKLDAGDTCGALADAETLQQQTIAAINAGRVPPRYQEELTSAVGALAASIPCTITPPTAPNSTVPEDEDDEDEDEQKDKGKGEGKGKGKKGKRG